MEIMVLFLMIFLHIVDDYYLQGCLAKLKQKKFWEENYPNKLYKNDYKIALFMHAFSWSFTVMLPITYRVYYYDNNRLFAWVWWFIINIIIHYAVDDQKANKLTINLMQDQIIHVTQIIFTWVSMIVIPNLRG